ncbi:spermatogenesis- and oogenesis-specific basic helix-loop-helix-containing protein 1 [Hipposideros larvatus]
MASQDPQPNTGVPKVPISRGCSGQFRCKDRRRGSGLGKTPAMAEGPGCRLPRNVLSERERRKRISASCEHLRALLPQFDGRREDMASVLEMSVQFLRLAGTLVPSWEQHAVLAPSKELWHKWQKDIFQLALASQTLAGAPDVRMGASNVTMQQAPPSWAAMGVDEGETPTGVTEMLDRPVALPGPPSLVPRTPGLSTSRDPRLPAPWHLRSQPPTSMLGNEEALSCLGQAGPLTQGTDRAVTPDPRFVSGRDVEDGAPFLLTASPDWWQGSLAGKSSGAPSRAPARSSPLDSVEPGFLADPEPGSQELPDGPLEPWGSDVGCPSLALRDEVDSIFPDFFTY